MSTDPSGGSKKQDQDQDLASPLSAQANNPPSVNLESQSQSQFRSQPPSTTTLPQNPTQYEQTHVHSIYSTIAPHFSSTRYKPWPLISTFINFLAPGSVGLDIGCGNGKYLPVAREAGVFVVGSDVSEELVLLARAQQGTTGHGVDDAGKEGEAKGKGGKGESEVIRASALNLPHRRQGVDFAICIAVLHHLSTRERRVEGVREVLSCLKGAGGKAGKALFYVWALEQKSSRRGWDEGDEQDVMVPWVMKDVQRNAKQDAKQNSQEQNPQHDSRSGETRKAGKNGKKNAEDREDQAKKEEVVYQRYYHLYRKGELEEDVITAGGRVLDSGWERDNWWVIAESSTAGDVPAKAVSDGGGGG